MDKDPKIPSDYYVYVHKNPETDIPFYVGKGRKCRAYDTERRHSQWYKLVGMLNGKFKIDIVSEGLSEEDAFIEEARLIKQYGKLSEGTGTLVNWTDGGECELGYISFKDLLGNAEIDPQLLAEIKQKADQLSKLFPRSGTSRDVKKE